MKPENKSSHQFAWQGMAVMAAVFGISAGACYASGIPYPVLAGACVTLALVWACMLIFPGMGNRGLRMMRRGNFDAAARYYMRVYDFYTRHPKLDKYRNLVMFNMSRTSFRELALCNTAFCLLHSGNPGEALEYYRRAAREFPLSATAHTNLRMMEAMLEHKPETEE